MQGTIQYPDRQICDVLARAVGADAAVLFPPRPTSLAA
jgi:hypothetical protein